jgi:endonuclease-3
METKLVTKIFSNLQKQNPTPKIELIYSNPFELLIAVILSAQATDVSVNKVTTKLFKIANTPEQIIKLGEAQLKKQIATIGLYNTKAKNIVRACNILVQQYNSFVPNTREKLENLPGVGRKTANVILNESFGEATIAVDTHVLRLANRIGLAKGKLPLQIEQQLGKIIPIKFKKHASNWLVLHGRYTCFARKPKCHKCVIMDLCQYNNKSLQ